MRLSEFAGVTLPDAQHTSDLTRQAEYATLKGTGVPAGEYDLYGSSSPMATQSYRADFLFPAATQALVDALLGTVGKRGTLKQTMWDASVRQTEAKLIQAAPVVNVEDKHAGIQRVRCEFKAEPGWYASSPTTISLAGAASVNLTGANGNLGNERAVKHVILSISTLLSVPLTITITPTAGTVCTLQYLDSTGDVLVINAGKHTVYEGPTNRMAKISRPDTQVPLLFLEPGNSVVSFSRTLLGSIQFRSAWK